MTQPLQGRRILVTGGATGIGAAAVQVLSEAGASVVAAHHPTPPPGHPGVSWLQWDPRGSAAAADLIDEQIKSTIPLGGALGDPVNDLGPTLVFLCSQGSRFITGQLIAVDGGLVMLGA